MGFPIDDHTGEPQSDEAIISQRYQRLQQLQRLFFTHHPELRELALANCGALAKRGALAEALRALPYERLKWLVTRQLRWPFSPSSTVPCPRVCGLDSCGFSPCKSRCCCILCIEMIHRVQSTFTSMLSTTKEQLR
jgi:Intron-binding protein aquarius N-terminus